MFIEKIEMASKVSKPLLSWYDCYGRKDLPWQHPRTAYRVWLSEIMLQQTQVKTVIPYFVAFIEAFPTVFDLAKASEDDVLAKWAGLGYYSRGRNLLKTAKIICDTYDGIFPTALNRLQDLPGIGPSTAAAIASQAYNLPTAILDGNVKRVLARFFKVDGPLEGPENKTKMWSLANACMPTERCCDYTQAIMDLGATCCTRKSPSCLTCPLKNDCQAFRHDCVLDYPFKIAKKPLPHKTEQFLLLHSDDGKIYLERRSDKGLWGGLWCVPILKETEQVRDYLLNLPELSLIQQQSLLTFKHTFTHFHLNIQVYSLFVHVNSSKPSTLSGRFFSPDVALTLGIPKPIVKIIRYFQQVRSSV